MKTIASILSTLLFSNIAVGSGITGSFCMDLGNFGGQDNLYVDRANDKFKPEILTTFLPSDPEMISVRTPLIYGVIPVFVRLIPSDETVESILSSYDNDPSSYEPSDYIYPQNHAFMYDLDETAGRIGRGKRGYMVLGTYVENAPEGPTLFVGQNVRVSRNTSLCARGFKDGNPANRR